tara:strand:- start:5818 stop:6594 length:777 start_codon:yes stop_codon:yes gene_type:complete
MSGLWNSNYAIINPQYEEDMVSIDNFFLKKEENKEILRMLELKGAMLSIFEEKEEIHLTEDELKEIHSGDTKINENIAKMDGVLSELLDDFNKHQKELNQINKEFQKEYKNIQKNASMVENMIDFIKKLPNEYQNNTVINEIIEKMNKLCSDITKNHKIMQIREEYLQKRKKTEEMLQIIKKFNNFNQTNTCPVCFKNQVDHFIDPCGHTFCKECIQQMTEKENSEEAVELYEIGRNMDTQCCLCRIGVKSVRPLYFL